MIKIGITPGDINGVGYEVILKTFEAEEMLTLCTPIIYGSPRTATYHRNAFECQTNFNVIDNIGDLKRGTFNILNCFGDEEQKIEYGKATEEAGKAAYDSLKAAIADLKEGNIDVLVTAPMNDVTVKADNFAGQTAYIEQMTGEGRHSLSIMVEGDLRIALATQKLPIAKTAQSITKEAVTEKLVLLHNSMKRDFYLNNPRLAVLALNPTYNPEEKGTEEAEVIVPVIDELFKRGVRCFGPYTAADFFNSGNYKNFDAVLAMYHDQGKGAFAALSQGEGVDYTAGLPVVVAAPAHGTEYEKAGLGTTNEASLRQAVYTVIDIVRNRAKFDKERANPLKKQYFEKRDDSDKLKLDQQDS